jgi:translation elongation factor EF-4
MNDTADVPFEGVPQKMGGKIWIIPALSFKQLKQLRERIAKLNVEGDDISDESIEAASLIVHAALSRNYPQLTVEEVEDLIDMRNLKAVIEATMGIAGLVRTGEA